MCLHAKCIQSGSIGSLYIIDEFYNTLTFCIIRLTKIVVIKLYIFRCILVCISEGIDDKFVALIYMPPA